MVLIIFYTLYISSNNYLIILRYFIMSQYLANYQYVRWCHRFCSMLLE